MLIAFMKCTISEVYHEDIELGIRMKYYHLVYLWPDCSIPHWLEMLGEFLFEATERMYTKRVV